VNFGAFRLFWQDGLAVPGRAISMENFVTISGCSSGGKSTLLVELRRRGFAMIDEPGRRIVAEELKRGGLKSKIDELSTEEIERLLSFSGPRVGANKIA
jgi:predicted ATPase